MSNEETVVPILFGDVVLGKGTINKSKNHCTIEIDVKSREGKQLLEFLETYPDLLTISFAGRAGRTEPKGEQI